MKEALNQWLDEYTSNRILMNKLNTAIKAMQEGKRSKVSINLTRRDIDTIATNLDKTLESNKESIMDCSYNIITTNKKEEYVDCKKHVLTEHEAIINFLNKEKEPIILEIVFYPLNLSKSKSKLEMVKSVKTLLDLGLREAKELIDALYEGNTKNIKIVFTRNDAKIEALRKYIEEKGQIILYYEQ